METIRFPLDAAKASFADALWPLMPWLVAKVLAWDPSGLATMMREEGPRRLWRGWVWWDYCLDHSRTNVVHPHTLYSLSPSWCRQFRRLLKRQLRTEHRAAMLTPEGKTALTALRRQMELLRVLVVLKARLGMLTGGRFAPSSPWKESEEWAHRLEEAFYHPETAVTLVPPDALVGHKEGTKLLEEIGPEGYGVELQSFIWQLAMLPWTLERAPLRANHPLWKKVEVNPRRGSTTEQAAALAVSSVVRLAYSLNFQDMLRFGLGGALRHQYGLSKDRGVDNESKIATKLEDDGSESTWEPEDTQSMRGYDDVDLRSLWESVRSKAPPKQQEAMDIYLEATTSGRTVDEVSQQRGRKPIVVRNNLAALKRKLRGKQPVN